jgi:hypothetical protein
VEGGSGGSKGLNGGLPALFLGDGEGFIQSGKQHQAPAKSKQRRVIALEPRISVCTELRAIRDGASMSQQLTFLTGPKPCLGISSQLLGGAHAGQCRANQIHQRSDLLCLFLPFEALGCPVSNFFLIYCHLTFMPTIATSAVPMPNLCTSRAAALR